MVCIHGVCVRVSACEYVCVRALVCTCVCMCVCVCVPELHCIPCGGRLNQQIKDRLPELKAIIQYMPDPLDVAQREAGVIAWEEFLQMGKVRPHCASFKVGSKEF